jgi:hypothetical protein
MQILSHTQHVVTFDGWIAELAQSIVFLVIVALVSLVVLIPYLGPALGFFLVLVFGSLSGYTVTSRVGIILDSLIITIVPLVFLIWSRPDFIHLIPLFVAAQALTLRFGFLKGRKMAEDEGD